MSRETRKQVLSGSPNKLVRRTQHPHKTAVLRGVCWEDCEACWDNEMLQKVVIAHEEALAKLPIDWEILAIADNDTMSEVKAFKIIDGGDKKSFSIFYATCWRTNDMEDYHKWRIDPESGAYVTFEEVEQLKLAMKGI